jgi:Protein of unknown function (DUF2800)
MTALDPRAGLPSASILGRLSNCAASWHLSWVATKQGIGNYATVSSDSGHKIHKWLETKDDLDWNVLSEDEQEVARKCAHQAETVIADWGDEDNGYVRERERRLWLYANGDVWTDSAALKQAKPIFSGQADLIVIGSNSSALVMDWKTGRGDYEPATGNPQLLALAVLTSLWTDARHIRVTLIQPWAGPPSVADYDGPALDEAKDQLLALLKHIEEPGLTPNPGNHCCYCPARGGICPATTKELIMLADPLNSPEAIEAFIEDLDGPKLSRILSAAKRAEWTINAARQEARRRLECADPGSPPGWTLREGARTREVNDALAAFEILNARFEVTQQEMSAACKVSLPEIESTVHKRTGVPKTQVARSITNVLGALITYGRKAPSLVEEKKQPALVEESTA